jgi:serine/threonine protein kinase
VLRNETYSTSCDVFSFGMIVCEMLCGHYPFKVNSRAHVSNTNDFSEDILKGQRPDMPEDANPQLVSLIQDCWQEEPGDRPKMDTVITALEGIRDSLPPPTAAAARSSRDRDEEWHTEDTNRQLAERKKQLSDLMTKQRGIQVLYSLPSHLFILCYSSMCMAVSKYRC